LAWVLAGKELIMKNVTFVSMLVLMSCGREATDYDYKLAGVGLNPEEISPVPENFGGVIGYDYVEFSGAGLSLALMGLQSFDSSGPTTNNFEPPYAVVNGSAFFL
jgi:hypothetical protein